jgi:hypothetical protein
MFRSYDHLHVLIFVSQIIMNGMRFRGYRLTQLSFNSCSLFYSHSPLHVSVVRPSSMKIYTSQVIMTGMRFRGFRLTHSTSLGVHYCIQILRYIFRSYDHLQGANIYITKYQDWHEVQGFPSNATLLQ